MPWKLTAERIFSGLFQKPLNYTEKMNIIETQNPVKFKGFSFKCRNTHEINNIFLLPDATYRLLLRPVFFSKI